jgi:ketosteroid isomerase-like protein
MSRENMEIVQRLFDAADRRDSATLLSLYDEAVVWDVTRTDGADFEGGIFEGHDGLRRWHLAWYAAWENTESDVHELIDAGGTRVFSATTQRARGKASGIDLELKQWAVWVIQDGKVIRVEWFTNRHEALEAAGLAD